MAVCDKHLCDASSRQEKLWRLALFCLGLLCITQAALNISLRLAFYNSDSEAPDVEASCKNVTEERDELKRKMTNFDGKTQDNETRIKTLTEERDELKRKLTEIDRYFEPGWMYFSGSLYYLSSVTKNWQESRADCLQRGADLMIINSKEEQSLTKKLKDNIWIGLTDRYSNGTWKWVDGTRLKTSFWMPNEPNNYKQRNEGCVEIWYHKLTNSWNDLPCNYKNAWICEKKVLE